MCSQVLNQPLMLFYSLLCVAVKMCPGTRFSGSLEVNTVDTCTVPTSTESITTAWTLSVTTRWAWVLYHFFWASSKYTHFHLYAANFKITSVPHSSDSDTMSKICVVILSVWLHYRTDPNRDRPFCERLRWLTHVSAIVLLQQLISFRARLLFLIKQTGSYSLTKKVCLYRSP